MAVIKLHPVREKTDLLLANHPREGGFRQRKRPFYIEASPTPRKTRFQLLVRLYWTGFPHAWFR